jgi:hypothetical protein
MGAVLNVALDFVMVTRLFSNHHQCWGALFLSAMFIPSLFIICQRLLKGEKQSRYFWYLICHPVNTIVFSIINFLPEKSPTIEDLLMVRIKDGLMNC